MNTTIKNVGMLVAALFVATTVSAQVTQQKVGDNPTMINRNAVLDVQSTNKGLLIPRLALRATDDFDPLTEHVAGMTVYNTATSGTGATAVTPGYYYNDGTKWVRLAIATDLKTEPWFDQATNTEATENFQNIYQIGNVAVQKMTSMPDVALDVAGAVRGGINYNGDVGFNSAAFGSDNVASGAESFATGSQNIASGENSVAMGRESEASGENSVAIGNGAEATGLNSVSIGASYAMGTYAMAFGSSGQAIGDFSLSLGNYAQAYGQFSTAFSQAMAYGEHSFAVGAQIEPHSLSEVAFGRHNAIKTGDATTWVNTDALFQLGNGLSIGNNAITVLKNAHTAIGVVGTEAAAKPTELLDLGGTDVLGQGGLRIRNINSVDYTGDATTDKIVVADADGVLKTVAVTDIASNVTADNGLTKTLDNIQLGGDLKKNTLITLDEFDFEIDATDSDLIISGLDKTKVQATVNGATGTGITQHLLAVDADNNVKALKAAMPKFFYMPSIIVPTSEEQLNAAGAGKVTGDAFNDATRQGTIQLHTRYAEQFGLTGVAETSPGAPALPVLPASELHYYVTWYDTNVFESVDVDASGVMTYKVIDGSDITVGSFMNIVFAVKED
ncbi:hypothetical protein [Parapedobacter soli]|uniref:hypothetical protein n=1 Tax=Parapedobacter soli TaxID=416955 RepID=UPI0021C82115|nr:hypothetical protein [Parapedobacter soli]